jgi:hypothetical protein
MQWLILICTVEGALSGVLTGFAWKRYGSDGIFSFLPGACNGIFGSQMAFVFPEPFPLFAITVVNIAWLIALFLTMFFGGGGWKRLKKKMSAAKEKLLAKVRELAPAPQPVPVPI